MTSLWCYRYLKKWSIHLLKYLLPESSPECRTMKASQRHQSNATVDVAKPLRRQEKRACVVHHEMNQVKIQKQNQSHLRYREGRQRRREVEKTDNSSVDDPNPDVSNDLSACAFTEPIEAVPAAHLPSQDFPLLTMSFFFHKWDDDVPVSQPAEHFADSQNLYATPSPSFASTPTEEPERDWPLPVTEDDDPSDSEVHLQQRKA